MNNNIIQIDINLSSMHALQNDVHEALEGSRSIFNPHWQPQILKVPTGGRERRFQSIAGMCFYLVEATGQIKYRKVLCIPRVLQNICDVGQGVGIPNYLFVKGSEINNNSPLLFSRGIEFLVRIQSAKL